MTSEHPPRGAAGVGTARAPGAAARASFDYTGCAALVTGGATSLGAAIAQALHAAGAAVWICDVDEAAGDALADALNARRASSAWFHATDVADDASVAACMRRVASTHGRLDLLVNNAVVYLDSGVASPREIWMRALGVNLVGGARVLASALELLEAAAAPAVVNLSSVAGKFGQRGRAVYPACKAAILQLTRSQAVDLAPRGIRVNAITPGWTWSAALARQAGGDRARADAVGARLHPLGRVGDLADVARAVLFLGSDAAAFVTGIDLPVDGGFSALGPDQGRPPAQWWNPQQQADED
ncbi:SDR family oxidoreductase [Thiomonas sp.]|jgi:NAD(P)-dependent dehydrogenase (short-subunit alcohol dehydrogenase family)|uniref:SDR family oxidoreductase n=1 Tax=Thiomonas sp. TaxID=2047785 RepID=UPI00261E8828|nr:SDR family oxidoreductase [Thiomonas sp.]